MVQKFSTFWQSATDDNNLTLHGFRRFKTAYLLNLRFLEGEIAELDHDLYQAGLSLNLPRTGTDRLGLRDSKRDRCVPKVEDTVTSKKMIQLRELIKQYGQ